MNLKNSSLMSMGTKLLDLRIKVRLFGGFAIVLFLLGAVAFISTRSLTAVEHSAGPAEAATQVVTAVGTFVERQLAVRVQINAYTVSGSMDDLTNLKNSAAALADSSKRLEQIPLAPELVAIRSQISTHVADYLKLLNDSLAVIGKRRTTADDLSRIGTAATNAAAALFNRLQKENQPDLMGPGARIVENLQAALMSADRYLTTHNPADADSANTALDRLAGEFPGLKDAAAANERVQRQLKALETGLPQLKSAIAAAVAADNALFAMRDKRIVVSGKLAKASTELRDRAVSVQAQNLQGMRVSAEWANRTGLTVSISALALGLLLATLIGRGISRPIAGMTKAMQLLAGGDTSAAIPGIGQHNEIGDMAKAVKVFKDNMAEAERLRAEQEQMKVRAEADKRAAMNKMADEFETSVKNIVQMVSSSATELQTTAQSMAATAEETSRQSTVVAAASEQASANVQTVASAAEELSSSISEIGRQVNESTQITTQAVEETQRTNTQIQTLAEAAQKIGDVVKLINDIAGQTNLLALNATIEAARAGDAGKGFAVVASEVKSLANQTAKATEDISAKISEMQTATGQSVEAVKTIGQTIGRVNEIATTIASAVEEQGAATKEISRNVQQASAGTTEVSSNIAGVTKAATETGAASSQVLGAAAELAKQSETLRQQVDSFIAKIRAA